MPGPPRWVGPLGPQPAASGAGRGGAQRSRLDLGTAQLGNIPKTTEDPQVSCPGRCLPRQASGDWTAEDRPRQTGRQRARVMLGEAQLMPGMVRGGHHRVAVEMVLSGLVVEVGTG